MKYLSRSRKFKHRGRSTDPSIEAGSTDSPDPVVFEPHPRRGPRQWANIFAGAAFACSLFITVAFMALTGLFKDEGNQRTILLWVAMPLVLTFASWMAVQSGRLVLRVLVWLSIVFIAFFIWIAAFSVGPYYLPVLLLLLAAGFAPWPGPASANEQGIKEHDADQSGASPHGDRISATMNPAPEE